MLLTRRDSSLVQVYGSGTPRSKQEKMTRQRRKVFSQPFAKVVNPNPDNESSMSMEGLTYSHLDISNFSDKFLKQKKRSEKTKVGTAKKRCMKELAKVLIMDLHSLSLVCTMMR